MTTTVVDTFYGSRHKYEVRRVSSDLGADKFYVYKILDTGTEKFVSSHRDLSEAVAKAKSF